MAHASLEKLLSAYPPNVRDLAMRARELILEQYPQAIQKVWAGWTMIGYGTGPAMSQMVCGIAPLHDRIRLHFPRGNELPDPEGLLEDRTGTGCCITIESGRMLESAAVRRMIREAFAHATRAVVPPQSQKPATKRSTRRKTREAESASAPTDEALRERTGRSWQEWFELLDRAGAAGLSRAQIAAIIGEHGAAPWWRQTIAAGYERVRGTPATPAHTEVHRAAASKTVTVPVSVLYDAWTNARRRRRWLSDARFTVRKATPSRSLRITWDDDTDVEVVFHPRGAERSQVTVDHSRLAPADVPRMKEYWSEHLARLKEILES